MTFTVFGITISVTRSQPADQQNIEWYPGAEKYQPRDFYEQARSKAARLWYSW